MGLLSFFLCFVMLLLSIYCGMFCHQFVTTCFFVDLLRSVVMSLTVIFFVDFHVGNSNEKNRSDRVIKSNQIIFVCCRFEILDILDIFGLSTV